MSLPPNPKLYPKYTKSYNNKNRVTYYQLSSRHGRSKLITLLNHTALDANPRRASPGSRTRTHSTGSHTQI